MNIKIVLEGKLKESFYRQGVLEYQKRLFNRVLVVEVDNILEYIKNKAQTYIITLEIKGNSLTSEEFSKKLELIEQEGFYNEILFLIGGAQGLDPKVCEKSNFSLSMSKMTFLHQEAVLILIEQIYRSYKIQHNEPYHK